MTAQFTTETLNRLINLLCPSVHELNSPGIDLVSVASAECQSPPADMILMSTIPRMLEGDASVHNSDSNQNVDVPTDQDMSSSHLWGIRTDYLSMSNKLSENSTTNESKKYAENSCFFNFIRLIKRGRMSVIAADTDDDNEVKTKIIDDTFHSVSRSFSPSTEAMTRYLFAMKIQRSNNYSVKRVTHGHRSPLSGEDKSTETSEVKLENGDSSSIEGSGGQNMTTSVLDRLEAYPVFSFPVGEALTDNEHLSDDILLGTVSFRTLIREKIISVLIYFVSFTFKSTISNLIFHRVIIMKL